MEDNTYAITATFLVKGEDSFQAISTFRAATIELIRNDVFFTRTDNLTLAYQHSTGER